MEDYKLMAAPIPNSRSPIISGQVHSAGQTKAKESKKDVFSGSSSNSSSDTAGDNEIQSLCSEILDWYKNLDKDMESSNLSHLRKMQDDKVMDKALKSYRSIDHPAVQQLCNSLQSMIPGLKKEADKQIQQKVAEEQEDLASLDCDQLQYKESDVDRANKKFFQNLVVAKKEEKENEEKNKLTDLNYEQLKSTLPSLNGSVKSFAESLMAGEQPTVQQCNAKSDTGQECKFDGGNLQGGSTENGMKVCHHEEASRGGGSTGGTEEANDQEMQNAHEEAACDCEKIAQEKGDNIKACSKGIAKSWKKLAEYIRGNATTAKWKNFSGGVLGTCRSDGKTCYSTKLRGNATKLKEVIVHECVHDWEFETTGTSDEKDTYNIDKEYSKTINEIGSSGGKKPQGGGGAGGTGGINEAGQDNPLLKLLTLVLGACFNGNVDF